MICTFPLERAGGSGVIGGAQLTPVKIAGLTGVTKIAAGAVFSLALRSDGTVWAWGDNTTGELGNGTLMTSAVPVHVAILSQVTGIIVGQSPAAGTSATLGSPAGVTLGVRPPTPCP